ncbi:YgaP-like transmembrane domain [Pseudomonas indica]|uniref:Inner membrane protein YgaP-like transmembrane domain-containing protein n=1 Tax=Pseudomonas indica TaxID=137658 RepID=A0A1G9EHI5_9PSED|nr:YgaP-like transmembrane domain [Pseudomonas indica]SDK75586.1 Protein of unknown function [Pseudomonas indica]
MKTSSLPGQRHTFEPNVHGWERTASIAGGLVLLGKGLRKGGIVGMVQAAMGGMTLLRGLTGRCAVKRAISEARDHLHDAQLDVRGSDLGALRSSAEAATSTATVTGNDSLTSPRAGL